MEYELFLDRFDLMISSSPVEIEDPSPLRLLKAASMLMTCLDGVTVMPASSMEEMPPCVCR